MGQGIVYKNWEEFWGELIQVKFIDTMPQFWENQKAKANWVKQFLNIRPDDKILEIACGHGGLGVCLAQMGVNVLSTDKNKSLLEFTKKYTKGIPLEVKAEDARKLKFPENFFHGIVIFEFLGLMSRADDLELLTNCNHWIKKGHKIAVDCSATAQLKNENVWEVDGGKLTFSSTYDPKTRIQNIIPIYEKSGQVIGLKDPIDPEKGNGVGIWRHFYEIDDLMGTLLEAGFEPRQVPHYSSQNHFAIIGEKI